MRQSVCTALQSLTLALLLALALALALALSCLCALGLAGGACIRAVATRAPQPTATQTDGLSINWCRAAGVYDSAVPAPRKSSVKQLSICALKHAIGFGQFRSQRQEPERFFQRVKRSNR